MNNNLKYRMLIQWSEEDNCFLVGLPDFPGYEWRTHGDTYAEAIAMGTEALESLIIAYQATGEPLPIINGKLPVANCQLIESKTAIDSP